MVNLFLRGISLALLLPTAACSLLFESGKVDEPIEVIPELRYTFSEAGSDMARSSGSLELDLQLVGAAQIDEYGLNLLGTDALTTGFAVSAQPARELTERCVDAGALTLVSWFVPATSDIVETNLPARIVTIEADDLSASNFTLAQGANNGSLVDYETTLTIRSGQTPALGALEITAEELASGQPVWTALVLETLDRLTNRGTIAIDVDGQLSSRERVLSMEEWSVEFQLSVGNAPNGLRQWNGSIQHLELYCAALTVAQRERVRDATDPGPR